MLEMSLKHAAVGPDSSPSYVETLEEIARRLTNIHASLAVRTEISIDEQIWFDKELTETLEYIDAAVDREQTAG